jgi:uncharacterized damage-inducible protein DinB
MDLGTQYQAFARYNSWMNRNLYNLAAQLSEEQRTRDVGAFFGSIHGTLGHLLLTDRVQMERRSQSSRSISSYFRTSKRCGANGPRPTL